MRRRIKCFAVELAKLKSYVTADKGTRAIEVARITGTVDKCSELDSKFRTRRRDSIESYKRFQLERGRGHLTIFPSISVYLLDGEYFVVDGNRRVAAAKRLGMEFIDANVIEYLSGEDRQAQRGILSRRRFEQETGLRNIHLSQEDGYSVLLDEARSYPEGADTKDRALKWYSRSYLPALSRIAASSLGRQYGGLLAGDIYVVVSRFYRETLGGSLQDASYESFISGFLFAQRIPAPRFYRLLPFRVLFRLLGGKDGRLGNSRIGNRP